MRVPPPSQTNGVVSWSFTGKSILHFIDEGLFLWKNMDQFVGLRGALKWKGLGSFYFLLPQTRSQEGFTPFSAFQLTANDLCERST